MTSKEYFDNVASNWDAMRSQFFPESVRDVALTISGARPGEIAADIGAGSGFVTEALIRAGLKVIAVDQSAEMLDVLGRKFDGDYVTRKMGTAEVLPLDDTSVDFVFANMYLHHVETPLKAIQEMARILRPGGKLIITDLDEHNFTFLLREHHDRWMGFKREEVERWFSDAGLKEIVLGDANSTCSSDSASGTEHASVSIFVASGTKHSKETQ